MAKTTGLDKFANRAFGTVTQSAVDTLTFAQIRFAVGLYQGVGLIVHRIDYYPDNNTVGQLIGALDYLEFGLTTSERLTSLDPMDHAVIGLVRFRPLATTPDVFKVPATIDFSSMPEGGLLVPPNPLFAAIQSSGFTAVGLTRFVLYCTFRQLTDAEYLELLQSMLPSNI